MIYILCYILKKCHKNSNFLNRGLASSVILSTLSTFDAKIVRQQVIISYFLFINKAGNSMKRANSCKHARKRNFFFNFA